uniref:C2H2-type domain-containing protein n=1 Tax=Plectus sambesii TaxID=2011161 RepID=A0A914WX15_9BILA
MKAESATGSVAISVVVKNETPSPATTPSPAVSSGSNKRHPCPHCDACFTFPNKLRLHVSRRHSGAHRCGKDGCSLTFDSFNDLRAHHKAYHRIRHTCSECRFVADRPALLRKHVETCHNNGVVCPIPTCGKRMAQRQLKNHLSTEHADVVAASTTNDENLPFQCERCQKRFRTRRNATKHFARAHAEKQPEKIARPRKFVCSRANCGKTFTTPQALDDHINSHEGVSPWLCNFCKRCFAARARLAVHLRKYHLISIQEVNPLRGNVS